MSRGSAERDLPWLDPEATGILTRPPYDYEIETSLSALSKRSNLLVPELTTALLGFAWRHRLQPECREVPEKSGGGEGWTLPVYHERLERWIQLKVSQTESHLGRIMSVRTLAHWCQRVDGSSEMKCWETNYEPRAYGLTSRTPPSSFEAVLELALEDALSYTVDDLEPLPIGTPGRPTGLPWAFNV